MSCTQCPTTQALCTLVTTQPGANTTPIANGTRTTTASECLGTQVCTCQLLQEHHILDGMTRLCHAQGLFDSGMEVQCDW